MNSRTTYIVLLLALLLAGYFLVFELDVLSLKGADDGQRGPGSGVALIDDGKIPAGSVSRLTLTFPDEAEPVVLTRSDDNTWQQTSPVTFEMNRFALERLIDTALLTSYTQKFDDGSKVKAGPDLATLTIAGTFYSWAGQRYATRQAAVDVMTVAADSQDVPLEDHPFSYALHIKRNTAAGRAYATLNDEPAIYVIGDRLNTMLTKPDALADLRSDELPRVEKGDLVAMAVTNPKTSVRLAVNQEDDTTWQFADNHNGRVNQGAIDRALAACRASIRNFVDANSNDMGRFGLDIPSVTVTMKTRTGQEHSLAIGRATDLTEKQYFAMWDNQPLVFTVDQAVLQALSGDLDSFRDDRLTPVDRSDVVGIKLGSSEADHEPIRLALTDGRWTFVKPDWSHAVEADAVNDLLDAIFETRAESFADLPGSAKLIVRVELELRGQQEVESLSLIQIGDRLLVSRKGETIVAGVNKSKLSPLMRPALFFRDRTVLDIPADKIKAIKVEHTGTYKTTHQISRDDQGNLLDEGLDEDAVNRLLRSFGPLRAASWLDFISGFEPDVTVTLTTADGDTTIALESQTKKARVDDEYFELTLPALEALTGELADRTLIDWPMDQLASVKTDGNTITRDEEGNFTIAPAESLTEAQAGKIFDTLVGLQALRYVSLDAIKIDPTRPNHVLKLTSRDGATVALELWLPNQNDVNAYVGRIGNRAFVLETKTGSALINP